MRANPKLIPNKKNYLETMKRPKFRLIVTLVSLVAILATSCSKKTTELSGSLFTVDPSPLELVGTKVPVSINGRFPAKWFPKDVTIRVTPVLVYAGGEALGTSQTYQGEKVSGNGITIANKEGGAIALKSEFDYIPEMQKSELYLRFEFSKKGNVITGIPDVKIAEGVVSTAGLADALTSSPSIAPDAFQRIIKEAYDADIMFLIQQAELRSSELNSTNLAAWKNLVKDAKDDDRKNLDVEISAYASPDGGLELNEKLAEKREQNTKSYLTKEFKKDKIDTEINAKYTAQDWDGFQKLVQASSLPDKDLVLRVLSMYSDPEEREKEIKNISSVYSELAETILPKLRRSRLIANVEIIGKTDEELKSAVSSNNLQGLSVEELLYVANLDGVDKEKVYTYLTQAYTNDYRGWNNLGSYYFQNNQIAKAKTNFAKASSLSTKAAEANANLALLALADNDVAKAEQLLGNAAGANTLNEALGVLYLKKGEYSKAADAFGDTKSNNAALAQILTKNYNKAQQTLNNLPSKNAVSYYLSAVVAARTNNASGVAGNLKSAIQNGMSSSIISNDLEFSKFLSNPDIANMLK